MEIRAKGQFDLDSIKALTHLSTYKKSNPKKAIQARAIVWSVLLLVIIAELIIFGFDFGPIILIVADLLLIVLDLFMYFGLPRMQYKSLAKMKDAENEYLFCDDSYESFYEKRRHITAKRKLSTPCSLKFMKHPTYFFLYQTDNQVFLVDKSTIEGGSD